MTVNINRVIILFDKRYGGFCMKNKYSPSDIKNMLEKEGYITSDEVVYAVFTALSLEKSLLIDGPAGVGKTELAKVMSKILESDLIRLQCYEGIDSSKVLYEMNYPKQLLYQNILKSNIDSLIIDKDFEDAVKVIEDKTSFYDENFILERPVLKAINPNNKRPITLLIDEVDKTDSEVEAMLLEPLSDYSISIHEYKTIVCREDNRPFVVLTSNNQRELSEALKRRCVYLYIDYPSMENEAKILEKKAKVSYDFALSLSKVVSNIRSYNLKQKPSIAESIEWCNVLYNHLNIDDLNSLTLEQKTTLEFSLRVLLKNERDIEEIKNKIKEILEV